MSDNITTFITEIESRWITPILFKAMHTLGSEVKNLLIPIPLATLETTLFYSVARGSRAISEAGGLTSTMIADQMTRSVVFEAKDASKAAEIAVFVNNNIPRLQDEVVEKQSRFAKLKKAEAHLVANLIYIRFAFETGNAAGHNMVTQAADALMTFIITQFPGLEYVSVSGNICVDKKVSVINAISGRGKHVISEIVIPRVVVEKTLKTTPEKIVDLNLKKNLLGSILAGSIHSANAHYANMLLAFYLATGQDAANIVEGSQGITFASMRGQDLYFSVTLPNIIVGTIGHGKNNEAMMERFTKMGCLGDGGAQKLAHITAGVVLAGELSLLAALTNPHELMKAHLAIERKRT
jgi:hydroxymethylglutaryl-CoA reductase (NADPH)